MLDVDVKQVREAAEKLDQGMEGANVALLGEKKSFIKDGQWVVKDLGIAAAAEAAEGDEVVVAEAAR